MSLPNQPWLDGINAGDGFIRQFVAVPLGSGATVEGQVTGQETHGGVQLRTVGLTDEAPAEYDEGGARRVFVHLCSAAQWIAITGETPPPSPVDRDAYVDAGLPWFDYYNADAQDLPRSPTLAKVKTVGEVIGGEKGPFVPVDPKTVITLGKSSHDAVTDGTW